MKRKIWAASIGIALLPVLAGCGHKLQTQEWYAGHLDDADQRVRWCVDQKHSNKLSLNPNDPVAQDCQNAALALAGAQMDKVMNGL